MTIKEIAEKINSAANSTSEFRNLQLIRAELKGIQRPRTYKIFSDSTIFEDDMYAFHDGGRSELQFNIGVEEFEGKKLFRYGLAFSLEPNQSQPDPINFLTPKIQAFNEFFKQDPGFFNDFYLWDYKNPGHIGRSSSLPVSTIRSSQINWGNFIVIGRFFELEIEKITEEQIFEIVRVFDFLMPLYKYVESNYWKYKLAVDGNRISRICWNDFGWVKPSGRAGKSDNQDTHEGKYGYGHEEWLGDISKTLDGYHYSFLESVRKEQDSFVGKKYNVDLFAIDAATSNRYHVGIIKNMLVIESEKASEVKSEYIARGWLDIMRTQIVDAGANDKGFSDWNGIDLFNICFKPEDLHFHPIYLKTNDEQILNIKRYSFTHKTGEIATIIPRDQEFIFLADNTPLDEDDDDDEILSSKYERVAKPIEITFLHTIMRNALYKLLVKRYGNCVRRENPTGQGTLIDIVRKDGDSMVFYEIKTFYNLKSCIREAVGQLLEYAFWPGVQNAKELIIVSQNKMTDDCNKYLQIIRGLYNLPIYYQHFDLEKNCLSEKY